MRKSRRSSREEREAPNPDRYLLTYADLITLLLGLFIILYASAQVDSGKYKEYAQAINSYFNDENSTPKSDGVMPGQKGIPKPIFPTSGTEKSLDKISQDVESALKQQTASGAITIERNPNGLTIRLSEQLLFASGEAEIRSTALPALDTLSSILRGIKQTIAVEGHTDSIPIRSFRFESNWHLSVQRALTVAYYCIRDGIPQKNLTISGYGAERPIAPNTAPEGRAQNRRVEITVKELPQSVPTDEGYITSDTETPSDNR